MLAKALEKLTDKEKALVFDSIPYITLLIGGSEGLLLDKEVHESERIAKVRSYTYHDDMSAFYKKVGENFNKRLKELINELPRDPEQANEIIAERLSGLTEILPKMDMDFADLYYTSLKSFARHVARSTGGFLNYVSISYKESKVVDLPMIEYDFQGK